MSLRLYNTLTKQLEEIVPQNEETNEVTMYNCGPTVYSRQHIGNYRAFTEWDILHRTLEYLGYKVNRITNMTDVGHMSADEDFGDDKMEMAASKEGKDPLEIADKVIITFLEDLKALNIKHPNGKKIEKADLDPKRVKEFNWTRATEYVDQMIEIIKKIEKNGYTYETDQAVYFDITKYPDYTKLSGQSLSEKEVGVRDEVNVDPEKKHPADFVLWMKLYGKYENHIMRWESPWGVGFPGWHIECTAMGWSELGEHIDIHTGGMEHIGVHHTNEIAQNYGALKHDMVRMWVHNAWLVGKKGAKMSKSEGKVYTIPELIELGYEPLDLRYYYLTVKYRKPLYFSLEGLDSARSSRVSLAEKVYEHILFVPMPTISGMNEEMVIQEFKERFIEALSNDLNVSEALAVLNELLNSDNDPAAILATVLDFDKVLGLDLVNGDLLASSDMVEEAKSLLAERKIARENEDYKESDRLREEIEKLGFKVKDTKDGQRLVRVLSN